MRVAAEAGDDVVVLLCPHERLAQALLRQLAEQPQRFALVFQSFRVLVRQVGEPALDR
jgi:hypothetical protein